MKPWYFVENLPFNNNIKNNNTFIHRMTWIGSNIYMRRGPLQLFDSGFDVNKVFFWLEKNLQSGINAISWRRTPPQVQRRLLRDFKSSSEVVEEELSWGPDPTVNHWGERLRGFLGMLNKQLTANKATSTPQGATWEDIRLTVNGYLETLPQSKNNLHTNFSFFYLPANEQLQIN